MVKIFIKFSFHSNCLKNLKNCINFSSSFCEFCSYQSQFVFIIFFLMDCARLSCKNSLASAGTERSRHNIRLCSQLCLVKDHFWRQPTSWQQVPLWSGKSLKRKKREIVTLAEILKSGEVCRPFALLGRQPTGQWTPSGGQNWKPQEFLFWA